MHTEEKKVEYLELIYDLVFVYIIGRNNSLLQTIVNGFVPLPIFYAYILCSLAVIQIWNFSTFYINMHGRNGVRDHIFLLVNMYLLYYIGEGTRVSWQYFQNQYHFAWALILLNIGLQYLIEYFAHRGYPDEQKNIRRMMTILFGECLLVFLCIPVYNISGTVLAPVPILFGVVATKILADRDREDMVDFPHLTERAMLYVVFTFGEMIITIAEYFEGAFTARSVYFSLMSFLIVVGLFLCYEILYDRIIDRDMSTNGMVYTMIHVFLIFALNLITTSLSFMRNDAVHILPKMLLLVGSFLLFFLCYFSLLSYAKPGRKLCRSLLVPVVSFTAAFAVLMVILRENMSVNIAATVVYVFAMFYIMSRFTGSCGQ